jgi:hypothetical protein
MPEILPVMARDPAILTADRGQMPALSRAHFVQPVAFNQRRAVLAAGSSIIHQQHSRPGEYKWPTLPF